MIKLFWQMFSVILSLPSAQANNAITSLIIQFAESEQQRVITLKAVRCDVLQKLMI